LSAAETGLDQQPSSTDRVRPLDVAGLVVAVGAGVALSIGIATGGDILDARWADLARLAAWSLAWAVGVAFALRLPARVSVPCVLLAALVLRLAALAGPQTLSDDLHRYSWDGRVQAAGFNPYDYPPEAPELAPLREPWLWPDDAHCAEIERPPGCTRINRPAARTIYPPAGEAWFSAVYRIAGIDARYKAWQVAGLVVDIALVAVLLLALRAWRRDERWFALYALSPFPVVEAVNNGHVDGLVALLVVAALLVAASKRPGWAGAVLGVAVLVKLYPAVLVAGLAGFAGSTRRRWSALVKSGAAAAVVVTVGYLPDVIGVGAKVLGYLPGYLREEDYGAGGRYLLAGMLGLPAAPTAALAAAGFAAVVAWVVVRQPQVPVAFVTLLGALLLATTPVQPWYAVPLVALAVVAVRPEWTLVAAAAYPYFFAVILDAPHTVAIGRLSYGLALVAVVVVGARRRIVWGTEP
jgi:hypothetical protein